MSLSIGIVGLPNVGKSTLFNALTNRSVPAENYPFCTIDPSVGVVAVPDPRLDALAKLSASAKVVPAAVEFTDIAGLVKGAAEGEGLGNQFLSHIRETDAIAHIVRVFKDPNIIHVHNAVDPLHDIDVIHLELAIADMQVVTKRRASLIKEIRSGDKAALLLGETLVKIEKALEKGEAARTISLTDEEKAAVKGLGLLTMKPILYVLNATGSASTSAPLSTGSPQAAGMDESRIRHFDTVVEAGEFLRGFLRAGDALLVKGSQSMRLERAVAAVLLNPEWRKELLVRQESAWDDR